MPWNRGGSKPEKNGTNEVANKAYRKQKTLS